MTVYDMHAASLRSLLAPCNIRSPMGPVNEGSIAAFRSIRKAAVTQQQQWLLLYQASHLSDCTTSISSTQIKDTQNTPRTL